MVIIQSKKERSYYKIHQFKKIKIHSRIPCKRIVYNFVLKIHNEIRKNHDWNRKVKIDRKVDDFS